MQHNPDDRWNPAQYEKFHSERSRPFWDLAKMVDFDNVFSLLDVGCGTGELTQALHTAQQLPLSVGFDSSVNMLEQATKLSARGLSFVHATVEDYLPPQKFDLVFSNAALQWVNDHEALFRRLSTWLKLEGTLAVQMPINFDHPSHRIAEEAATEFGVKPRQIPVLSPEKYARLLWNLGFARTEVSVKVYLHPMPSALDVVEWTKGTLLTYYEKQLTPARYQEFIRKYTTDLMKDTGQGEYLYTFKRLFLLARR